MLIAAVIHPVVGTATDAAFNFAAIADARLLGPDRFNGVLAGPRSKRYGQPPAAR